MPSRKERVLAAARRMSGDEDIETVAAQLHPDPSTLPPLPPSVPMGPENFSQRLQLLKQSGAPFLTGETALSRDPADYESKIENFVGLTQIPTGLAGPVRIHGLHAKGDFYLPMATSEGALVASYSRGCGVISRAGGATALVLNEQVQRAPGFLFTSVSDSALFCVWVSQRYEELKKVAATRTRHGELVDVAPHMEGNQVHLLLHYHTGDAAGQNMVTFCSEAICRHILEHCPVKPRRWYVEGNMSGDKKATHQSLQNIRGRKAIAEVLLPAPLVEKGLHTTPEAMEEYWRMSYVGGSMSGSIGAAGHVANALAAMFLACGQDVACVSEAAVGMTRMEHTEDGSLYVSVTLPNLIVGTVGGGTTLPTAAECLSLLGCLGSGGARKFAEICAVAALAGEISIIAALCSGDFASAHEKLGRKP